MTIHRRPVHPGLVALGLAAAFVVGCSGGGATGGPGADLMKAGQYSEAVAQLAPASAARPKDARLKRNLGVAQFKSGDARAAAATLAEAHALDPKDDVTLFYQGQAAEAAGDLPTASQAFEAYLARHPGESEVATRLRDVNRRRLAADIDAALKRESTLAAPTDDNTLAVMEFKNFSSLSDLEPLGKGLCDMITSDLARVERFRVVERTQMSMLVDELKLAQTTVKVGAPKASAGLMTPRGMKERLAALTRKDGSGPYYTGPIDDTAPGDALTESIKAFQADRGMTVDGKYGPRTRNALGDAFDAWASKGTAQIPAVDAKTAPRLGKLLAARLLVQGGFSATGEAAALNDAQLRIDAGLTETTSGQPRGGSADVTGPLTNLFGLEKELVYDLLHQAGIELTREERNAIGHPPTRSVDAFLAYSKGLDEEDRGRFAEARAAYSRAVALDPGFAKARARLGAVSGTKEGFSSLDARISQQMQTSTPTGSEAVSDRLLAVGAINGGGLVPGRSGTDRVNPITPPVGAAGGTGTVVITGEVPR